MTAEPEAHEGVVGIGEIRTMDGPADLKPPTVKFVHYPGSQQLILWLPKPAHEGYAELSVTRDGADVERGPVSSRVNGSVQILFGTLEWPPADYRIAITHREGWRHEVELKKYSPGQNPPAPPAPLPEPIRSQPVVYRDGFGKVIPDTDLEIRGRAQVELERRFGRRVEYEGTVRAGTVIYTDAIHRIVFENEMCGGALKACVYIPSTAHWVAATGAPLAMRDEIIAFVAERVQQERASAWRYRISDTSIDFY